MADYLAPFHGPQFTDEEFEKQRAAYVEKNGYTVTIPTLSDVIHLRPFKPLTPEEERLWKAKQYDMIPADRLKDIREEKDRKRRKFLAMLGDPSPKISRNAAAILTALDDVQDAVSTLACIGLIAGAVIGGPVAAAIAGPLGLILGASTLLNLLNPMSHLRKLGGGLGTGRAAKKKLEDHTDRNPFSKKAKAKTARRIKNFKPTLGNAIEALQTTDQIYGIGISIGPISGFAQMAISGIIRKAMGQKVTISNDYPPATWHEKTAAEALRACAVLNGYQWESDATDETLAIYAASLAMQTLHDSVRSWNPFDEIEDIGSYVIEAPTPTDPLTLEIFDELGIDPETACKWPQNDQRWISLEELQEATEKQATANLRHYGEKYNHTVEAFNALTAADDYALNTLSAIEGPEEIRIDYLHTERAVIAILDSGWIYPEDITPTQIELFEDWLYVNEYLNQQPTRADIQHYAETFCGFSFVRSPEETR